MRRIVRTSLHASFHVLSQSAMKVLGETCELAEGVVLKTTTNRQDCAQCGPALSRMIIRESGQPYELSANQHRHALLQPGPLHRSHDAIGAVAELPQSGIHRD